MFARHHVRTVALAALAMLAADTVAQDNHPDAAIEAGRSGAATREQQAAADAAPPATDDKHQLTLFHHRRGIARTRIGDYAGAVADLHLALENHQRGKPAVQQIGDRWRIQNDLGNAYEARGDWFGAIGHWTRVAGETQKSDPQHHHFAQLHLFLAHSQLRHWSLADRAREDAEAALTRMRATPLWARWGNNSLNQHHRQLAGHFLRLGNYAEAERHQRASLDAAEKHLETAQRAFTNEHQEMRIAVGNVRAAKTALGDVLATQGKYGEAEIFARAGLREALAQSGFNTTVVSYALMVVGWARFQQGDFPGAEDFYRHALAALEGSGVAPHSTALAGRRAALANAMIAQGRWEDALKLFEARDKGLRADAAQFKRFGSNHISWALAVLKTGQAKRAAGMAGRLVASALQRPLPDSWEIARRRGLHGMALAATGARAEALPLLQQAIPDLMRRDQDDDAGENSGYWRAFWQRTILEGYLELLAATQQSGESVAGLDIADESFRIADMARSSVVQEAIVATAARARLPDRALAELARQEHDTRNRIVALNQLLGKLAAGADHSGSGRIVADMRTEIESLRAERTRIRADIRKRFPDYAELVEPRAAGFGDMAGALGRDEAAVAIYLGERQAYVWTAMRGTRSGLRVVPLGREAIERDVHELRKATDFGDGDPARLRAFDLARAHGLYRALLEPDAALWKNATVLNVIPHGALGELPFSLLITAPATPSAAGAHSGYATAPWLARAVAIAQLPSASAFIALRRTPAGRADREAFIGFGDPLFKADAAAAASRGLIRNRAATKTADDTKRLLDAAEKGARIEVPAESTHSPLQQAYAQLGALPDTSDELRAIAAALKSDPAHNVYVRRSATEKTVKETSLVNRRVIAFATHGLAPGEILGLDQPALVLSNPALTGDADNDGFLTMDEVLGLKLDADWVVLSACNTASADGSGTEAVSGLGRAFFYAGARSLLVSNWAVETTSARELTTELFRRQAADARLTRAEALRQSMLALMARHAVDPASRQNLFSYSHPAFWAPFVLMGDSGAR